MAAFSCLDSVVPEIKAMRFVRFREGKLHENVKVIGTDRNVVTMFANGDLHSWLISPGHGHGGGCYLPSEHHIQVLSLCVRLGAITQMQLDEHIAAYRKSWNASQIKSDLNRLEEMMKHYGKKTPALLLRYLKANSVKDHRVSRGQRNEKV